MGLTLDICNKNANYRVNFDDFPSKPQHYKKQHLVQQEMLRYNVIDALIRCHYAKPMQPIDCLNLKHIVQQTNYAHESYCSTTPLNEHNRRFFYQFPNIIVASHNQYHRVPTTITHLHTNHHNYLNYL